VRPSLQQKIWSPARNPVSPCAKELRTTSRTNVFRRVAYMIPPPQAHSWSQKWLFSKQGDNQVITKVISGPVRPRTHHPLGVSRLGHHQMFQSTSGKPFQASWALLLGFGSGYQYPNMFHNRAGWTKKVALAGHRRCFFLAAMRTFIPQITI